jgi:hypothetical protein
MTIAKNLGIVFLPRDLTENLFHWHLVRTNSLSGGAPDFFADDSCPLLPFASPSEGGSFFSLCSVSCALDLTADGFVGGAVTEESGCCVSFGTAPASFSTSMAAEELPLLALAPDTIFIFLVFLDCVFFGVDIVKVKDAQKKSPCFKLLYKSNGQKIKPLPITFYQKNFSLCFFFLSHINLIEARRGVKNIFGFLVIRRHFFFLFQHNYNKKFFFLLATEVNIKARKNEKRRGGAIFFFSRKTISREETARDFFFFTMGFFCR